MLEHPNEILISKREYFTLIAAILAALAILFNNNAPQIDAIRSILIDRYAFFQAKLSWFTRLSEREEELSDLRLRTTRLMLENSQLREAYLENHRLRTLLDYRERTPLRFVPSRVLFKEIGSTPNAVVIDLGKEDGMRLNLPVVTPEGLVGKIFKVNQKTSNVQLMLDHNFSVSARTQRSRVLGIVTGDAVRGLEMTGVSRNADVVMGDVIVTSDSSALFPPGVRIGVVDETSVDQSTLFMKITIDSGVEFSQLEEVFVVLTPEKYRTGLSQTASRGE